jgi:tetratricopeptide (TPR) repeat protein
VDKAVLTNSLLTLGTVYRELDMVELAQVALQECEELSRTIDDRRLRAAVLAQLGINEVALASQFAKSAVAHLEESLRITELRGDQEYASWVLVHLGLATQAATGDPTRRLHYVRQSVKIAGSVGSAETLAWARTHEGEALAAVGDWDAAIKAYELALRLHGDLGLLGAQAWNMSHLGHAFLGRGELDEAENWFTRSRETYQRAADRRGEATALEQLASLCVEHGRQAEALAHLNEAVELFRKADDEAGERRALARLGDLS